MTIITISGKAESGKDTFANYLKLHLEARNKSVLILHNADYLKFICSMYLGWDGKKDEQGRELLQQFGTNYVRKEYDSAYWIKSVVRVIDLLKDRFDYFLVPDTRFSNECSLLRDTYEANKYDGSKFSHEVITVNINRMDYENSLTEEQRNHESETALVGFKFDHNLEVYHGLENSDHVASVFADWIVD